MGEPGNRWHVGAPTSGAIVNVGVTVTQRVAGRSTLQSLEAMRIETHMAAEHNAEAGQTGCR